MIAISTFNVTALHLAALSEALISSTGLLGSEAIALPGPGAIWVYAGLGLCG